MADRHLRVARECGRDAAVVGVNVGIIGAYHARFAPFHRRTSELAALAETATARANVGNAAASILITVGEQCKAT